VVFYEGVGWFRLIFPLAFVLYCSLFSGFWFWCLALVKKYRFAESLFFGITFCYFWFVDSFILSPFGKVQGYPLAFPLVPIMKKPELLFLVSYVGKWGMLLLLILLQISLVKGCLKKQWFLVTLCCLFPFGWGLFFTPETGLPAWVQKIHFEPLDKAIHQHERAQHLVAKLAGLKNIKLFIFPESYFPFVIDKKSNSLRILQGYILQNEQLIFFGANQIKKSNYFNCALLVDKCRIIYSYEKSHLIPFFEYNPYTMNQIGLFFKIFPY
jgi:apolipoprotein N-acyltransferase